MSKERAVTPPRRRGRGRHPALLPGHSATLRPDGGGLVARSSPRRGTSPDPGGSGRSRPHGTEGGPPSSGLLRAVRRRRLGAVARGVPAGSAAVPRPPVGRLLVPARAVVEAEALGGAEHEAAAEEDVVGDLGERDEGEAHAEAEQTAAGGDVGDAGHLLGLAEALRVALLDEDVDDGEVLVGVLVDLGLDGAGEGLVVEPPAVVGAAVLGDVGHRLDDGAEVRVLGAQGKTLVTAASSVKWGKRGFTRNDRVLTVD